MDSRQEGGGQRAEKKSVFKIFLSCLKMWIFISSAHPRHRSSKALLTDLFSAAGKLQRPFPLPVGLVLSFTSIYANQFYVCKSIRPFSALLPSPILITLNSMQKASRLPGEGSCKFRPWNPWINKYVVFFNSVFETHFTIREEPNNN